jgi:hypothetical protein
VSMWYRMDTYCDANIGESSWESARGCFAGRRSCAPLSKLGAKAANRGTNSDGTVKIDNALQAGCQIDVFGQVAGQVAGTPGPLTQAAVAGLAAIAINDETKEEIQEIHQACVSFLGAPSMSEKRR